MPGKAVALVCYCRPGFEAECAAELAERGPGAARRDRVHAPVGSGWVTLSPADPAAPDPLMGRAVADLVFTRQAFLRHAVWPLPPEARLPELRDRVLQTSAPTVWSQVLVEAPDTEDGKTRWPSCRTLERELTEELAQAGRLRPGGPRLHVCFPDAREVWLGASDPSRSSAWPMGIPRLRVPGGAPSRSARKLEEALHVFLEPREQAGRLKPGMGAVDLGAAPGGWTWQFTRRGLVVSAVDNGPLDRELLAGGLVEHVRADGFTYRPARPVDWLLCDMVAPPARVARLVSLWAGRGLCREAIFNLKLPGRDRYREVCRCAALLRRELERRGVAYHLRFKHLYHDRDEVTGHLRRLVPGPPPGPPKRDRRSATRTRGRASAARRKRR